MQRMREQKGRGATWKHFYDPTEAWQRLTSMDIDALRDRTHQAGAPRPYDRDTDVGLWLFEAKGLLGDDHAAHYAPIYLDEIAATASELRGTMIINSERRQVGASPRGVQWSCELPNKKKSAHVITAFRPQLPDGGAGSNADYAETAARRFKARRLASRRRRT